MDAQVILGATAIGLGATLLTDLWNLCLKAFFGIPSLDFCLLGRWLLHMPSGTFMHKSIAAAPGRRFECVVGRTAHYSIGIALAFAFIVLVPGEWLVLPTLLPALLYGISTVVFPLFIMQPAFGLGFAGARTPKPAQTRLKSLMTHTVFGFGLWGCAVGMNLL
ncbi:MAG: DUF2938 domain-containing protein [Ignavibacteriae bacterium]|nr:DUF2938 domain-containing protein [Ignavibacteriota bacterium]